MTIRIRLYFAIALLAGAVLLGAVFSALLLRTAEGQLRTVRDQALQPIVLLELVKDSYQTDIIDAAVKVRNDLITWEDAGDTIDIARGRIATFWDRYVDGIAAGKDTERTQAAAIELRMRNADAALTLLRAAVEDRDVRHVGRFVDEVMYPTIDPITARLGDLVEYKIVDSNLILSAAGRSLQQFETGLAIVLALVAATALAAAWIVQRQVSRPLLRMTQAMTAVADGDLQHHIPGAGKRDEIGELARALKIFRDKARALDRAQQEAQAATKAKSDFLATMSHEIRTPMNGVMSMAEMLELTRLDADQQRMAKVIRESAGALLTVINDILDFSKIEAGKLDIETIPFSLSDAVEGVGELLAPRADDRGLDLVVDIDPALAERRLGDPTRLRQILLNLGGNAIKFTERGHVHLSVAAVDETLLRFEIRDTGIGLTDEQQAKLFQPFAQADSSTARKFGGTGLGLSICHRLCSMMGGRIGVTSAIGDGSCFWFELPLPAEDGSQPLQPGAVIAGTRVLPVGLPPAMLETAVRYLQAAGVTVLPATADLEAAALLPQDNYDVALVDARCATNVVAETARRLPADRPCILLASRYLTSTLDAAAATRFRATLTYPLHRGVLWRAVAVARGLAVADDAGLVQREDMAFAPPDFEIAAAAKAMILVAEDNPTNQMVIRQMLARMGFACDVAKDGAAALRQYRLDRSAYGLLLTDFHMPEMDGFALTAAIRAEEKLARTPRLPVIALTADALSGTEQKCLEAGMDGYLTKPIDSRALNRMLSQWLPQALSLRQPAGAEPPPAASAPALPWDSDIFDPEKLAESFGSFNAPARQLLQEFIADTQQRLAAIDAAIGAGDIAALRHLAHALKGGALTIGIGRLGALAANLQDACDDNDAETATLMAELLAPTLDELRDTLPAILKH
jgi:signal transduction histidine kinase/HPt (histidine-containing phosphotransfer) domain-containing protein/ActR/RegA family two-component response regulator